MARTILIAAGGTGGHLFPGIAVADELVRREPRTRVVFAGTQRGLESRLVPKAGYELALLPILPLNGISAARLARGLLALPWGLARAAALVVRLRPAAVLGIGGYAGGPVTLLAFGGSQGSRVLNEALVAALPGLPPASRLRLVHQTGPAMHERVAAAYRAAGRDAEVVPFLDDMPRRLADADLVLSRSGATTCAELTAAGRAAVLVPFAAAADDHQRTNARALAGAGAARMLEERDLTGESLAATITALIADPAAIAAMEAAARRLARPDAAARVADLLLGFPPPEAPRV